MGEATSYQKKEIKCVGMKVYAEFPEPTENDNKIINEVKDILTGVLQEYIKKSHNKINYTPSLIHGKDCE